MAKCWDLGVMYADPLAGPYSDLSYTLILHKLNVRWEYLPLDGFCEILWPPICGVHLMQIDSRQTFAERHFALRHGMAHVLAGHCRMVGHARHDWQSHEEQVADNFAAIDLIPDCQIRDRLTAGWEWRDVRHWIMAELLTHGPSWEAERVHLRTEDRLWLFAEREGRNQGET